MLATKLQDLHARSISLRTLGVRSEFHVSEQLLGEAIGKLSVLDQHKTPLDKCQCVQDTLSAIAMSISMHNDKRSSSAASSAASGTKKADASLTTDDMIPLLAFVLIRAKDAHSSLRTNLLYTKEFLLTDQTSSPLGCVKKKNKR